jgi:hypothetical protein
MTGYFSRLARQSGVRVGGEPYTASARSSSEKVDAPLERDETIMVAPSSTADSPASKKINEQRNAAVTRRPRQEQPVERVSLPNDPTAASPQAVKAGEIRSDPAVTIESVELVDPPSAPIHSSDPVHVERFMELKNEASEMRPDRVAHDVVDGDLTLQAAAPSGSVEEKFFRRTRAIMEGHESEPSDASSVLIHEIQEWIAAGDIAPDETLVDKVTTVEKAPNDTPTIELEAGVVRIDPGDARPGKEIATQERTSLSRPVEEQNLEISIGSISVVVEGNDPSPAPAVDIPRPASRESAPRTSRGLSRHYI